MGVGLVVMLIIGAGFIIPKPQTTISNAAATIATPKSDLVKATGAVGQSIAVPPTLKPCGISDFSLENFKGEVINNCSSGSTCPKLRLTGLLRNKCLAAAGAQIKITALDASGSVIEAVAGWPANNQNIGSGSTYPFDISSIMRYRPGMKSFSAQVLEVRDFAK
jgi:hypothetical protein